MITILLHTPIMGFALVFMGTVIISSALLYRHKLIGVAVSFMLASVSVVVLEFIRLALKGAL